ncbi:M13 family metallopeptidase [Pseudoalteromonas luteoviolacea]|uniref:M13 family metallopeptidase n=1 Tax=Pseudoalteromonas luteoviolacea TaxID=43657 RepID=UPI001F1D6FA9|nr:M13 family metallopeptidase [Pseudoalteromonas luteoviolacea]MCF6439076.1 M13 family metallopeptidase [Pseudoalteromonas luteoviolacea]
MRKTFAAIGVALALGLAGCSEQPKTENTSKVVQQQVLSSGIELDNIDQSIRPQDDFYRHVNGKWFEKTEIPADKSNYGSFTELHEKSQAALKVILEKAAKDTSASPDSDEYKLGAFYKSYTDELAREEIGVAAMDQYLAPIKALTNKSQLPGLIAKLQLQGGTTPFAWYVYNDAKNSTENALYLYQSGLGLPDREFYLKDTEKFKNNRDAYQVYITDMLFEFGYDERGAKKAAEDILALETQIAQAQWTRVDSRDASKTYNKLTVSNLNKQMAGFDISEYFAALGVDVEDIIVSQPSYFTQLSNIVNNTDIDAWRAYLTFHLVSNYAELLERKIVDLHFGFYGKTLRGLEAQSPMWKKAADASNDVLGELLGKIYVKEHFPPEAKARMSKMVDNLILGFDKSIDDLEWMSAQTKTAAKAKLNKFTPKIGYPDQWRDYSALEINADDLVGNYIRYNEWSHRLMIEDLGKPVDRSRWYMTPQTVNAYYNPVNNEIVFPAAILQPPFFNLDADDAVNYGAIGAVIGHEIGHGFDDQGAKYDGDGNLRNWWTESDLSQFEARGKQLINQFNGFKPFDDVHVNGELTLGENIGDLGGLTVAYKAYKLSLGGEDAPVIDGYTGSQRFFMGWGQIWRREYREEELRNRLMTDSHSPSEYRVIGILSNMPQFHQAFDVKEGDGMYKKPEERVKIW